METALMISPTIIASLILSAIPVLLYLLLPKLWPRRNVEGSQKTPPGSTGWPVLGETLDYLKKANVGVLEKFINDRKKKHSSKVFKTSLFGHPMVMFSNSEGNKFAFSHDDKLVTMWVPMSIDKIFDAGNVSTSDDSSRMRKLVTPLVKPDHLRKCVGVMDAKVKEHLKAHWEGKQVVEVHPLAKNLTFHIACRLLLGMEDVESIDRLSKPFQHFTAGLLSLPIDLPGTSFRRAIRTVKELQKVFESVIRQWKDGTSENKIPGGMLLQHALEITGEGCLFTESELAMRILGLISASYDNVSITMTFVIKYLAELPEVYNQVLREQREIVATKVPGDALNWDDIQKMRYTWNVASEVLRLHPPSTGAFREVMNDFTYDGFLIPKGWKIHWNTYATHKNPEYFPDPEKFDPSRFEKNTIAPYSYTPFGGGPHVCPGKDYAKIAVLAFVHHIVTQFKFEKVIPNEGVIGLPTLRPAKGLPIRLYPQQP